MGIATLQTGLGGPYTVREFTRVGQSQSTRRSPAAIASPGSNSLEKSLSMVNEVKDSFLRMQEDHISQRNTVRAHATP
jgi:hypothetical protein